MKRLILLSLFVCVAKFIFADTIPEQLIYRDSVLLFCVHNNQVITITQDKEKNYLLSVDGQIDTIQATKSTEKQWRNIEAYHSKRNSIYFTNKYRGKDLYELNLYTKKVTTASTLGDYGYIINNTIVRGVEYDCGYDVDCEAIVFNDLNNQNIADTIGLGDSYAYYLMSAKKIFIEYYESGSVYGFGYYDWNTRKLIESIPVLDTMEFKIFIDEKGRRYSKNGISDINYAYTDITGSYSNLGFVWVDKDFNVIQKALQPNRNNSESSFNIGVDNPYYYRYSYVGGKKFNSYVWVACKFSLPFDKALYEIYHNTLLEKNVVETFDEWELNKLRNMIFAKHGYQFKSEYLQAFFNLFNFYNNITKTVDVTNSLTPIDKKNLELIRQAENKIKGKK